MRREDWDRSVACADCNKTFDVLRDPVFVIEDDDCLCLACATRRGALYDEPHDMWLRAPDLRGLV